jgi:hypothetical protein
MPTCYSRLCPTTIVGFGLRPLTTSASKITEADRYKSNEQSGACKLGTESPDSGALEKAGEREHIVPRARRGQYGAFAASARTYCALRRLATRCRMLVTNGLAEGVEL